jgi:hypothetical protein
VKMSDKRDLLNEGRCEGVEEVLDKCLPKSSWMS